MNISVGSWTCKCGTVKWSNIKASGIPSVILWCDYCEDATELLPLPMESTK